MAATRARKGVNAWKRLNAPPGLRARRKLTVSPTISTGPSARSCTAQILVTRSRTTTARTIPAASPVRAPEPRTALSASFGTRLAVDAGLRVWQCFEAFDGDTPPRRRAQAVGLVPHPLERAVDLLDDLAGRCRQHQVAFALDADRVALAAFLVELRVALLAIERKLRGLGLQFVGLTQVPGPLFEQLRLEALDGARREVRLVRLDLEA